MLKNLIAKRNDILLILYVFLFPITIKHSNTVFWVFSGVFLLVNNHKETIRALKSRYLEILLLALPVVFIAITVLYSKFGLTSMETYLLLVALPILLAGIPVDDMARKCCDTFMLSILVMMSVCTLYGVYNFLFLPIDQQTIVGDSINGITSRWNALTNKSLMLPFEINPIYMSLFVSFAFYIALYRKFNSRSFKITLLIFFVVFQFLLGSRIGSFAFIASLIFVFFWVESNKLKFYLAGGIVFAVLVMSIMIALNPVLQQRFLGDLKEISPPENVDGWNALNIRVAIWDCSLDLFKAHPLLGYGVDTQYEVRDECYNERYTFFGPYGDRMNSHNQYFEFLLMGGMVLLSLFLIQLGYALRVAIMSGSRLYLIFLILFMITCLGESLLETHKGVVFYALFNAIFIFTTSKKNV